MRRRAGLFDDEPSTEASSDINETRIDLSGFTPVSSNRVSSEKLTEVAKEQGFNTRHGNNQSKHVEEKLSRQFNIRVKESTAQAFFQLQSSLGYKQAGLLLEELLRTYHKN